MTAAPARTLFAALVLGPLRTSPLRTAVTAIAVALGVAIGLAIDLANATAVASFSQSVNVVANHVNLQVLAIGRGFDERTLLRVQDTPGVRYASPTIEDALVLGARPGDPFSGDVLRVLGIDLLRPLPRTADGVDVAPGAFAGTRNAFDPYVLVGERGAILSQRIATRYHLHVGGDVTALAGDRPVRLRVAGIIPAGVAGIDSSVVFVDIVTAQEIFGKVGLLDRIDCIVDSARLIAVQRALERVVPPGARVIEPKVRTSEITRMLRSFQLNLAALSYVALLVGMYLIYNTVAISVVQRRPEVGTLRAIGATRGQIFAAFLGEGALFGVVGGLLGLVFGSVLATLAVGAVTRTVDALYVGTHADHVIFAPLVLFKAFAIGVASAIASALAPALEAAATLPAITMRAAGYEARRANFGVRLIGISALSFAVAYGCSLAPAIDGIPLFGYLSGVAMILGASLAVPFAVERVAAAARAVARNLSPAARLGVSNLAAAPWRNSVAVASLMIAIAMMVSVAILVGSFRTTVVAWADETIRADLFIRPLGLADASYDARFSPDVARRVAAVPGVAAVDTFRAVQIPYGGSLTNLAATDFRSFATRNRVRFLGRVDPAAIARELPGSTDVVVSEPFVTRFGGRVGDRIVIPTPSGRTALTIVAVYNDYSSDAGVVLMDESTFVRLFHDDSVNSIAVYVRGGADLDAVRSRILRSLAPRRIDVESNRELRAVVIEIFNRTFAITNALYVISITIAVLGIVSTLFALVLERRREIGLLRYLGVARREVRAMVLYEAGAIGVLGGGMGIGLGVLLSFLLIYVINRQAFGWLIELSMPYAFLGEVLALVTVAAVLAGVYPAGVAARIRTAEAVRSE